MQADKQTVFWRRVTWITLTLSAVILWIALDTWLGFTGNDARTVEIPNCRGKIAETLELAEYFNVTVEYRYDDEVPEGVVIAQAPTGGTQRKLSKNTPTCAIKLVVSLGREQILLPDAVGSDVREAVARLREMGLQVKTVMQTGSAPEGAVLAMQPTAGATLARGDTVTLTVSAGAPAQTVKVPDLAGLSRADALMRLWLSQLTVGEVIDIPSDAPDGTVVRQSHRAGTVVMAGTRVTVYIADSED